MDILIKKKYNYGYVNLWNQMERHGKLVFSAGLETQFGMIIEIASVVVSNNTDGTRRRPTVMSA